MSNGARIFLGVALILIALGFLALMPMFAAAGDAFPPATLYGLGILAAFCGLGAVACFSTASHPVTIRVIGGTVFVVSLMYVGSQVLGRSPAPPQPRAGNSVDARLQARSRPSVVNSLLFFGLVGLPSGYAALTGRYPGWGAHSGAFGGAPGRKKRRTRTAPR